MDSSEYTPDYKDSVYQGYVEQGIRSINSIEASLGANPDLSTFSIARAIFVVVSILKNLPKSSHIYIIGNGGSASIASETANRFWKFCRFKSMAFNDPAILTSTANDMGWERVFELPLNTFAENGDVLIAISSSGESPNIINAVTVAKSKGLATITLSGFKPDNRLRQMGILNFYVPRAAEYPVLSSAYRHTERTHLFILDCILDTYLLVNPVRSSNSGT